MTNHTDETIQMETDTTTYEREAIIQAAQSALTLGHIEDLRAVRRQILEHMEMYEGDEGLGALEEQLRRVEETIGEQTPPAVQYMTTDDKL
jgi:hypothetical protein